MTEKHQTHCNECGNKYFLEDAEWCIHYFTLGKGSKMCTQCHDCICHGETLDTISDRFTSNIEKEKFVPVGVNSFGFGYMCRTVKKIEVKQ